MSRRNRQFGWGDGDGFAARKTDGGDTGPGVGLAREDAGGIQAVRCQNPFGESRGWAVRSELRIGQRDYAERVDGDS